MKLRANGILDIDYSSNEAKDFNRVILLLHGYSESGEKIFKRLSPHLPGDKNLIIAPNGIFPLVDRFPLETTKSSSELLRGHAWYFYDQQKDEYIVDYIIPVSFLNSLLTKVNPEKKPITIIGYSQGGYLSPFLAADNDLVEDIFGINCSYRHDLFPTSMNKSIHAFQGADDPIIDIHLAKKRHEEYGHGDFTIVADENHRLSPSLSKLVCDKFMVKHN